MSDTGRRLDVEDVLSSIRRLVSEQARIDPSETEGTPGKLVLTPSLRVPESEPLARTSEIEKRISDIENLVKVSSRPLQPPPLQVRGDDPDSVIAALGRTLEGAVSYQLDRLQPPAPAAPQEPSPRSEAQEMDAPAPDLPDEAPATEASDGEPVGADATAEPAEEAQVEGHGDEAAPHTLRPEPPLRAVPSEAENEPAEAANAADEPDAAQETPEDPESERFDVTAETESAYIDEELLREIVSEMVRSELQGELGDRITRNVRKLVRREIARALASREFD